MKTNTLRQPEEFTAISGEREDRLALLQLLTASNDPWAAAAAIPMERVDGFRKMVSVEPGARFFCFLLECLGCQTLWSCEGHPYGFYITFTAPYEVALLINSAGYCTVEVSGMERWALRRNDQPGTTKKTHDRTQRWMAKAWLEKFGPLLLDMYKDKA